MTRSQINKLGERLRAPGPPGDADLASLQAFRAEFDAPMLKAQVLLDRLGVQTTARLKTVTTIVEKLRREKTRLAQMQDIAGLRMVRDMALSEQDALVAAIVGLFPGAREVDRRARPSHGYRAVHVIATVDAYLVEIQVRTGMQDLWAQAMERLADSVGREIRYGGVPKGQEGAVDRLQRASREIASLEDAYERLRGLEAEQASPDRAASLGPRDLESRRVALAQLRDNLTQRAAGLRDLLSGMLID